MTGVQTCALPILPGEFEVRKGKADITGKLCVIGSKLKEDDLAELFEV